MAEGLHRKLDPARFPNVGPQMAAIEGFVLGTEYTTSALAELTDSGYRDKRSAPQPDRSVALTF